MTNPTLRVALATVCCLAAVSACSSGAPAAGLTERGKPTAELTASVNRFQAALKARDAAALRKMAAPDRRTDHLAEVLREYGGRSMRATSFEGELPDDIAVAFSEVCSGSGKLVETFGREFLYRDKTWRPSFGDPKKAGASAPDDPFPTTAVSFPPDTSAPGC
jgi:hypothetical protein